MRMIPVSFNHANTLLLLLQIILAGLTSISGIYFIYIFLRAPYRHARPAPAEPPQKKFLVMIPARNEKKSIGRAVKSLLQTEYPRDLLDIVVIADNCTDNTAEIALSLGVKVLVRSSLEGRTKAGALKWAFAEHHLLEQGHDAVTILDADCMVMPDYFTYIDRELREGAPIVFGRRLALNAGDSIISSAMSIQYSFENRMWFLSHSNRNRSVNMIGTGVTITCRHFREFGWDINTLVEDTEFGIQSVLAGINIRYCDEACFYVEMPSTLRGLWRQMRRWFSGMIECMRLYLPAVTRKVIQDRGGQAMIMLINLILPFNLVVGLIQLIIGPIITFSILGKMESLMAIIGGSILNQLAGMLGAMLILLLDGRIPSKNTKERWRNIWKGIIFFPYTYFFYGLIYLYSFILPKKTWDLMRVSTKPEKSRRRLRDYIVMK
jgi:cellulose synthase/poly-beta-1,6-N-acetylglucosamine synthase-like glycosyltransferase